MAAALHTARYAHDARERLSIQCVMVPQMVVSLPLSKNIYEKLSHSFLTDSRIVTSTPHPRDRQGQRRA
ncbi:hypothetical protein, partial [Chloroflexus aurantiacus]